MLKRKIITTTIISIVVIISIITIITAISLFSEGNKVSGTEIDVIASRFPAIKNIENCYYEAETIGTVGFGPTNYRLTAIVIVEEEEMEVLIQQYSGEQIDININTEMLDSVGLNGDIGWYFNQEFQEAVLGTAFIGEVYFSEEKNAIYLEVENL